MRVRWQGEWYPGGWFIELTVGGSFGIGFMGRAIRYNGVDIYLGPICLTVQPPVLTGGAEQKRKIG